MTDLPDYQTDFRVSTVANGFIVAQDGKPTSRDPLVQNAKQPRYFATVEEIGAYIAAVLERETSRGKLNDQARFVEEARRRIQEQAR